MVFDRLHCNISIPSDFWSQRDNQQTTASAPSSTTASSGELRLVVKNSENSV